MPGVARPIAIDHVLLHGFERRAGLAAAVELPIGTTGKWGVLRITGKAQIQAVERTNRDHFAPIIVQIARQRAHPG